VDDSAAVRGAIRKSVETTTRFRVCGEAENGLEAVQKAMDRNCDLVLLDIGMPHLNGIEAAKRLRLALPRVKLVAFSMLVSELQEELLASNTFDAILSKSAGLSRLMDILKSLVPIPPEILT
jgi:two-component system, chemotaxis family, protein-glutamate methylesterase/glutaminase